MILKKNSIFLKEHYTPDIRCKNIIFFLLSIVLFAKSKIRVVINCFICVVFFSFPT